MSSLDKHAAFRARRKAAVEEVATLRQRVANLEHENASLREDVEELDVALKVARAISTYSGS